MKGWIEERNNIGYHNRTFCLLTVGITVLFLERAWKFRRFVQISAVEHLKYAYVLCSMNSSSGHSFVHGNHRGEDVNSS